MWRRFATHLRTLGPARCATKPVRCAVRSSGASGNVPRTFAAVSRHFSTESVGNTSAIRVEDILSIATGHEQEEIEAFLKGKDLAEIDYPEGPFGTKEAPAVIKSSFDRRTVGCPGVEGEDEHDVVWFWLEKGKTHECPVCSQCFALEVVGPGGSPDGHAEDEDSHHH